MVPWDRDKLPTLHGTIPPKPDETARCVAHSDLLAAAPRPRQRRHRRVLAGRGRLVQSLRAHQAASALLPGQPLDDAERAAVEPATQRISRHRAVGRMGVVGRHRDVVEDARGADRGRPQLLAEHRAVLGLGHRRLLSEQRAAPASSTRAGISSRRSADRSARTAARGGRACRGAGAAATWARARTTTRNTPLPPATAATSSSPR